MSDEWDAEDFNPDVSSLAPPPVVEEPVAPVHQPKVEKKKEINMESLGRELTAAEREEIQRRNDLKLAQDMFGEPTDTDEPEYKDIVTKEEFENYGVKIGTFINTRHKATHYGDLLNKLILTITEKLDASEIRKISTNLKLVADSKKDDKPKPGATGAAKKKKAQLKGASKGNSMFDDYGKGGGYDKFDDFEDDFM
ncbi:unnamed protein product [Auanema sp. JU1783]|nr:unnamed protein product [Auanema sp. JU1783]